MVLRQHRESPVMMELNSGNDLISLKESIKSHQAQYSPTTESPPSAVDADQYARCNGLTIDSLLFDWQRLIDHDHAITSTLPDLEPGQLIEGSQLQECLFRAIIPTSEQWQLPATSLKVLQEVCTRHKDDEVADLASQQCFLEALKWKSLKLEAPALRSDNVTDCRQLARQVKAFLKEPLPDHRLPLHPADIDSGEGLEFSKSLVEKDRQQMKMAERESFGVTKDTLVYLMQSLKSDLSDADKPEFVESVSSYQRVSWASQPPNSNDRRSHFIGWCSGALDTPIKPPVGGTPRILCPARRVMRVTGAF
jgi:hypothetical protein